MILHFVKISGLPRFSKTYHGQCPSKTIIYTNLFRGESQKITKHTKFPFHVFDRYEIHIQAFVHFINGKLIPFFVKFLNPPFKPVPTPASVKVVP